MAGPNISLKWPDTELLTVTNIYSIIYKVILSNTYINSQVSAKVDPNAQEETQFVPFTGAGGRLDGKKHNAKQRAEVLLLFFSHYSIGYRIPTVELTFFKLLRPRQPQRLWLMKKQKRPKLHRASLLSNL